MKNENKTLSEEEGKAIFEEGRKARENKIRNANNLDKLGVDIITKTGCGKFFTDKDLSTWYCGLLKFCPECQSPKSQTLKEKITEKKVAELEKGCGLIEGGFDLGNEICGTAHNFESKFFCNDCKQKAKEMIEKLGCGEDYIKENNGHRVRCSKNRLCQKCHNLKEKLEKIK